MTTIQTIPTTYRVTCGSIDYTSDELVTATDEQAALDVIWAEAGLEGEAPYLSLVCGEWSAPATDGTGEWMVVQEDAPEAD